jgi:hypothetical protein
MYKYRRSGLTDKKFFERNERNQIAGLEKDTVRYRIN